MLGERSTDRLVRGCLLTVAFLSFAASPVRADLLLFYNFDDDADPLVAVDESGNGNDGIINGNDLDGDGIPETPAVYTDQGLGRTGLGTDRAIDFLTTADGTYISVPNATTSAFDSMTTNDAATVTMWLFGSDAQPVNQWNFWFGPGRQLGSHVPWSDGTIYFDVSGCCGGNQRIQRAEPDSSKWKGEWNHYAFVKEQETTRIYQNGELFIEGSGKAPLGAITEVFFGAGDSNHSSNYNGLMDDIGVWDEALSQEAIQDVMENGIGPPRPISIRRNIPDTLINGTSGVVTITVLVRVPGAVVVINEKLPAGLTASNPSGNGVLAGDTITWNLGKLDTEVVLTYTMTAALDAANAKLPSTATADGEPVTIGGDTFYNGSHLTSRGFIRLWQHLGPLAWKYPAAANDHGPPGACDTTDPVNLVPELSSDWIVNEDGSINEANVLPFPDMVIRPKYGGTGVDGNGARAAGLAVEPGDSGKVVQDRFPVWRRGFSPGDTIDHASAGVNGFDAEDHVTLSSVYVTNHTGADIDTNIGVGSDDAIQIFINDVDVTAGGLVVCRGWGASNEEQDTFPVRLPDGESRLLVKVSDGCCQSGFRLRFQDPQADPFDPKAPGLLPPALTVSLESALNRRPGSVSRSFSKTSLGLEETVEVSLAATLSPAANVTILETLPPMTTASAISDSGKQTGNVIEWTLASTSQKTVSYMLAVTPCAGDVTFGGSSFKVGSNEVAVDGASTLSRLYKNDDLGEWQNKDVGGEFGGSAQRLGDHDVLVNGTGGGVRSTKDEFHFVSHAASGDFEITARIDCFDHPSSTGLAGVMVRAIDDPAAANVFLAVSPVLPAAGGVGSLRGFFRRDIGKPTSTINITNLPDREVAALPIYLRIQRAADVISLQRSGDGVTFTTVATRNVLLPADPPTTTTKVALGTDVLVGLAVSSTGAGSMRAGFSQVSGPSFSAAPPRPSLRRGDINVDGKLDVTDPVNLLGYLFLGGAKPQCLDAGDTDDDGKADISDAVSNLGYQFLGGPAPADPGPFTCAPDVKLEDPELGCDVSCR